MGLDDMSMNFEFKGHHGCRLVEEGGVDGPVICGIWAGAETLRLRRQAQVADSLNLTCYTRNTGEEKTLLILFHLLYTRLGNTSIDKSCIWGMLPPAPKT